MDPTQIRHHIFWRTVRWFVWGGAAALLSLPLIAMQFTGEVQWTALDFAVMGTMLLLVCAAFELTMRVADSHAFVIGAAAGTVAAFLVTWANLAVGMIGEPEDPRNLWFMGAVLVALLGAAASRLKARGLALAMAVAMVLHGLGALTALVSANMREFMLISVMLAPWILSWRMFREAAHARSPTAGEQPLRSSAFPAAGPPARFPGS